MNTIMTVEVTDILWLRVADIVVCANSHIYDVL